MPMLIIVTRDGTEREVVGQTGLSIMEVIRAAGIDDILAICGGCCSCATCHVHIDAAPSRLPPMSEAEDDLLSSSADRDASSRLSCQIRVTEDLDGLRLRIAAED